MTCPHCGHAARVRTSRQVSDTTREAHLQCQNVECGHTFAAQTFITHTISPSRIPNPAVVLPIAPARRSPSNENSGSGVPPPEPLVAAG